MPLVVTVMAVVMAMVAVVTVMTATASPCLARQRDQQKQPEKERETGSPHGFLPSPILARSYLTNPTRRLARALGRALRR